MEVAAVVGDDLIFVLHDPIITDDRKFVMFFWQIKQRKRGDLRYDGSITDNKNIQREKERRHE